MRVGHLRENSYGRYALEDGYYWTCGDSMEIYVDDEEIWLEGRVEADSSGRYYFTDDDCVIYLHNGLLVRVEG